MWFLKGCEHSYEQKEKEVAKAAKKSRNCYYRTKKSVQMLLKFVPSYPSDPPMTDLKSHIEWENKIRKMGKQAEKDALKFLNKEGEKCSYSME